MPECPNTECNFNNSERAQYCGGCGQLIASESDKPEELVTDAKVEALDSDSVDAAEAQWDKLHWNAIYASRAMFLMAVAVMYIAGWQFSAFAFGEFLGYISIPTLVFFGISDFLSRIIVRRAGPKRLRWRWAVLILIFIVYAFIAVSNRREQDAAVRSFREHLQRISTDTEDELEREVGAFLDGIENIRDAGGDDAILQRTGNTAYDVILANMSEFSATSHKCGADLGEAFQVLDFEDITVSCANNDINAIDDALKRAKEFKAEIVRIIAKYDGGFESASEKMRILKHDGSLDYAAFIELRDTYLKSMKRVYRSESEYLAAWIEFADRLQEDLTNTIESRGTSYIIEDGKMSFLSKDATDKHNRLRSDLRKSFLRVIELEENLIKEREEVTGEFDRLKRDFEANRR